MAWASCVAEAPESRPLLPNMTFMPAASRACVAPSMRGWMFSEPGWAMTPTAVSPFFISEASRVADRLARDEQLLADVGQAVGGVVAWHRSRCSVTTGMPADSALLIGVTNEVAETTVVAMPGEPAVMAA